MRTVPQPAEVEAERKAAKQVCLQTPSRPPPDPVRDLDSSKEPVRCIRSLLLGILGVHNVGNTRGLYVPNPFNLIRGERIYL